MVPVLLRWNPGMIVGFLSEEKHIPPTPKKRTGRRLCMLCLRSNPRGKKEPRKKSSSLPSQGQSVGSNLVTGQLEGKHTALFASAGNRQRRQVALHTLPINIISSKSCIDIFHTLGNTRGTRRLMYRALKRFSILLGS